MSIEQIEPEALKLPTKERALLAAALWESLGDPYSEPDEGSEDDAISLAITRDKELETGTVTPLTHAEVMRRLGVCPEVPGANGQGETIGETKDSLSGAIELLLEVNAE